MKGYDILTQLRTLTPEQLDNWLQYFWGKVGCDFEGFRDNEDRPEFPYAKYVTEQATESFGYISMKRPDLQRVERTAPATKAEYEADHPPIVTLGHENLSAEDLQKLHQNLSQRPLVAPADNVENEQTPHFTSTVYDAITSIANEQASIKQQKQEMIDGLLVSTDTLAYHLIPVIAIERLCERIMLGEETKGKDAWNAMSANQSVLDSRPALARRFGHGINHAYRLLGKLQRNEAWTEEDEKEASAFMWAGMYAICAIHQQREKETS